MPMAAAARARQSGPATRRPSGFRRRGHFRDEGDADPRPHHLDEGRERTALQHLARRARGHVAEGQRLVAETVPLLQQEQAHLLQHLDVGNRLQGILGGPHQQKFLSKQRNFGEGGLGHGKRHDGGVEAPFGQFAQELCGQRFAHMNVECRGAGGSGCRRCPAGGRAPRWGSRRGGGGPTASSGRPGRGRPARPRSGGCRGRGARTLLRSRVSRTCRGLRSKRSARQAIPRGP